MLHRRGDPYPRRPRRSRGALTEGKHKDATKVGPDGETLQGRSSLLNHLATLTYNTVVFAGGVRIDKLALPTALQHRAFELVGALVPVRIGGS